MGVLFLALVLQAFRTKFNLERRKDSKVFKSLICALKVNAENKKQKPETLSSVLT